jgi:trehalose 6-phosphate synthase/phosphatase
VDRLARFLGQLPLDVPDWPVYQAVNERFADAVAANEQEGDLVWVHDYQLMLVPRMVRQRIPDARIGFFLHIPFPPPDAFRTLPARERLLDGLLGADLVGFHTASYLRNFASSVLHVLGVSTNIDRLSWQGRASSLGVFPMGIDAKAFEAAAHTFEASQLLSEFRGSTNEQLLVGIDRLDDTKGMPRRLLAFERLLERYPELHGRVRLVQVAVPTRTGVDAYAEFRTQVEALVGHINGRFGSPQWAPVHYVYRGLSEAGVAALYRAADVMLVTPIRDGMNLVAKEFCAARSDEDGVLVLSEFAGAAAELAEALHVNPYDVESTAEAIRRALAMPREERRTRMRAMRRRVFGYDVHRWSKAFLEALEAASARPDRVALQPSSEAEVDRAVTAMVRAPQLLLLLDYDGTLTPIVATPDLARPDQEIRALLSKVAAKPGVELHSALLTNAPVELLSGDRVVDLRPHGSNKGRVAQALLKYAKPGVLVAAFGDDVTDEDLFAVLPKDALSFHVGPAPSRAKLRLDSWEDVRRILRRLAA